MMAMAMNQRFALKLRKSKRRSLMFNELAQQHSLLRQPLAHEIIRQQVLEFVPEDRRATWLQHHEVHPTLDLRTQLVDDPLQITLGFVEHPKIVERTPAA